MVGKTLRLSKIINPITKRTCIVPMDHGITLGPTVGLKDTSKTITSVVKGGADAIIIHKGMFSQLVYQEDIIKRANFILHLSASTSLSHEPNRKYLVSSVEQAVRFGATAVSIHVNLGDKNEGQMLSDLGMVSDICINWGMPLLAMMYVKHDNIDSLKASEIIHAARVAEELGADIIKISCPEEIEAISELKNSIHLPVVISGGSKISNTKIIYQVCKALEAGADGVSIGRNIFMSKNCEMFTSIICDLVHNGLSYEQAVYKAEKYCEGN